MSFRLNAMTMPDFLSARYDSKFLKIASAIIIFVFLLPYSASVYTGLSYLFQKTIGIDFTTAVIAMGVGTAIYLVIGGYHGIALTDLFQGIIMIGGSILLIIFIISAAGGIGAVQTNLPVATAQHSPNPDYWLGLLPLVLMTSFGPLAMPQMVQKFYAIKNEQVVKTALIVSTFFAALVSFAAYFTGALTHLFFDKVPAAAEGGFDVLIPNLMTTQLPPLLTTLILLLILSASMSTLASLILVSGSSIAMDLWKGVIRPNAKSENVTMALRVLCAAFVLLSMYIAIQKPAYIVNLMAMSWGAVAGAFLAPFIFGLFWKRATKAGAITAMVSGVVIDVGLNLYFGTAQAPLFSVIAMVVPVVVLPVVSLVTQPVESTEVDAAFAAAE
jgi:SSS family transporter